ncbi:MAG: hypothetical protein IIT86_08455 [Oscillospiraceae bacterium]|nr:hypothetical protein [Oscillospiraceae bacterium]
MSIKNVKVRFNLDKENDRRAYEYLKEAEVSYSKAVISIICGYMDLSDNKAAEDAFLERVIQTIRQETASFNPLRGLLQLAQTPPVAEKPDTETEETVLDFLGSF